ncbi:MAG: hypothetical protein R3F31_04620 [Verrucomicrobiales bacterium]
MAVIGAWSMVQYEYAQSPHLSPAMNARLQELLSPPFPDESARQKAAVDLITTHGRNEAEEMLAEFVSSHSLDANQLYEARELGQHLRQNLIRQCSQQFKQPRILTVLDG